MSNTPTIQAPSKLLLALEPLRVIVDLAFMAAMSRPPSTQGKGRPVILIPGMGTLPLAMEPLRQQLTRQGFLAHHWGSQLNLGPQGDDVDAWIEPTLNKARQLAQETGEKVSLIGWSLGGFVAREVAKKVPDQVSQVVTLGTPLSLEPDATNVEGVYRLLNPSAGQVSLELLNRLRHEAPVPSKAIYSKTDGIVGWQTCLQKKAKRTQHVELSHVSHLGLVVHPDVLREILTTLLTPT